MWLGRQEPDGLGNGGRKNIQRGLKTEEGFWYYYIRKGETGSFAISIKGYGGTGTRRNSPLGLTGNPIGFTGEVGGKGKGPHLPFVSPFLRGGEDPKGRLNFSDPGWAPLRNFKWPPKSV